MSAEACESEDLSDPGVLHRGGCFRNSSSNSLRGERGGQVAPSGFSSCLFRHSRAPCRHVCRDSSLAAVGPEGVPVGGNDVDDEDVDDGGGGSDGVAGLSSADRSALHTAELCERVLSAGWRVRDR